MIFKLLFYLFFVFLFLICIYLIKKGYQEWMVEKQLEEEKHETFLKEKRKDEMFRKMKTIEELEKERRTLRRW